MAAADHQESPIVLMIDRDRRLLDCSSAGADLLDRRDLLACEFGRVSPCRRRDEMPLERVIASAAALGCATLVLGGDALSIEIVRLGAQAGSARLLLICYQKARDEAQHVEDAAHLFGLTAAEHRLLEMLFSGVSLAGAAELLGVARTTARTHLQRIFDKTGSRRQSDLVRLVALGRRPALPNARRGTFAGAESPRISLSPAGL